jgi:hypothetical protein
MEGLATFRGSRRRLVACAIALSLGLISILMPARMLAGDLQAMKVASTHEMAPCQSHQPTGGEPSDQDKGCCEAGGLCIASCSPVLVRLPDEVVLRTRIVASILLPGQESGAASLFHDPPKRPPRIA